MTSRRARRRVVWGVIVLGVAAWSWGGDEVRDRYRLFAHDRHERRWEARAPDSYRYELRQRCFCAGSGDYQVRVVRGRIVDVSFDPFTDSTRRPDPPSIPELIAKARDDLERGSDRVDVRYDRTYGFVSHLSYTNPHAPDGSSSYSIRDFRPDETDR